jgi:hypothetical protein
MDSDREQKQPTSIFALLCWAWLAIVTFGGVRESSDTWYLNVLAFGWPALVFLLFRLVFSGRLLP